MSAKNLGGNGESAHYPIGDTVLRIVSPAARLLVIGLECELSVRLYHPALIIYAVMVMAVVDFVATHFKVQTRRWTPTRRSTCSPLRAPKGGFVEQPYLKLTARQRSDNPENRSAEDFSFADRSASLSILVRNKSPA